MTTLGLGIDIVDVEGFADQLADRASGFVDGTFTARERRAAPADEATRRRHLAGRFAAKEAFVKAWSCARLGRAPALASIDLREVEIVADEVGRPMVQLRGAALDGVRRTLPPYRMLLSISHDGGYAAAVVVLDADATPDA